MVKTAHPLLKLEQGLFRLKYRKGAGGSFLVRVSIREVSRIHVEIGPWIRLASFAALAPALITLCSPAAYPAYPA